jgi:hypothetical protein
MPVEESRVSFARWQSITIAQLTYCINLILGMAVATLGFQIALLLNDKFNPIAWQNCAFSVSMLLLILSVALGIWCVVNRLRDFRATTKAARMQEFSRHLPRSGCCYPIIYIQAAIRSRWSKLIFCFAFHKSY